ncbi:hypothetical protein [Clostridium sp. UBA5119]|uniref:hypothetical protein n=1 Tax=Clostridium sp. UBA5119 TaxID=1946366 RepID=UPI003217B280
MKDDIKKFLILYAECFIIIFVMGGVLPNILDYVLSYFYKPGIYENSILVGNELIKPLEILYNYIHIFNSILR